MKARAIHVKLDPAQRNIDAVEFEDKLRGKVVGQDDAVRKVTTALQTFMAGLNPADRPISNMLFLGPTGTGKTRLVEAVAETMHGDKNKFIKVDCAEFQESHSISKLLGSPPGYIGHKETKPFITQERINQLQTDDYKVSLVLFDEIEKAALAFFDILLSVLDKGRMTMSSGDVVDFTKCIIIMTSNLGSKDLGTLIEGALGFTHASSDSIHIKRVGKVTTDAARRHFRPEFFNRIDHTIIFKPLEYETLRRIVQIELAAVQKRIFQVPNHQEFIFTCTPEVEDFLIREGSDKRYGARDLKRAIERHIVDSLSNLLMSGQVTLGDLVRITFVDGHLEFDKIPSEIIASLPESEWADFHSPFQE